MIPFLNLLFLKGLQEANTDSKFAEEPEFTINAYFDFSFFAKIFSNKLVLCPIVIFPDFKTFMPAFKSSLLRLSSDNG